ncbi:MAG: NfeD family protein [bacterium]
MTSLISNLNKVFIIIVLILFSLISPVSNINITIADDNNIGILDEKNDITTKDFNYQSVLWVVFAVLFIIFEINTLTLTSLWFAFGSIVAMISTNFTSSNFMQFIIFLSSSLLFIIALTPLTRKYIHKEQIPTNVDRIINMIGIVIEEVTWNSGQVKVDGKVWTARLSEDDQDLRLEGGTKVEILEIKGVKLMVKELELESEIKNKELVNK